MDALEHSNECAPCNKWVEYVERFDEMMEEGLYSDMWTDEQLDAPWNRLKNALESDQ